MYGKRIRLVKIQVGGFMYGVVIGDLAGSIYEYNQTKEIISVIPDKIISKNSFYSDDTILTIAIIDAILHDKNYDYYLRKYIKDYKDYKPNFSPYFKTPFSPNLIKWSESNIMGTSCGNGAIMRISPIGYMFDSEEEVIENAYLATIPTHNKKEAIDAAVLVARIIYHARHGLTKREIFNKLNIKTDYKPFTKFNMTCDETLYKCLYMLENSNNFENAIRKTLLMGGDTDTNCAIVGSMAEAFYGIDKKLIEEANKKIPDNFQKMLVRGYNV